MHNSRQQRPSTTVMYSCKYSNGSSMWIQQLHFIVGTRIGRDIRTHGRQQTFKVCCQSLGTLFNYSHIHADIHRQKLVIVVSLPFQLQSQKQSFINKVVKSFEEFRTNTRSCGDMYAYVDISTGWNFRMNKIQDESLKQHKMPVLLWHGLLDSSACWVVNGADRGLAFILADRGFDVWMGNSRGNSYSLKHVQLDVNSDAFWDFSWDEMALLDVPATIDTVLQQTNKKQLLYVGHSQGCLILLAALSRNQFLQEKIAKVIMLAPAVFASHIQSSPFRLLADLNMGQVFKEFGVRDFLPSMELLQLLTSFVCDGVPLECSNALFMLVGYDPKEMNNNMLSTYLNYYPAGTSVKNIIHWGQMVLYKGTDLRMYDYGQKCYKWLVFPQPCNQWKYGQQFPPTYNLSSVKVPMEIFRGGKDILADPIDVGILLENLDIEFVQFQLEISTYNHLDFILGWDANTVIYPYVLQLFKPWEYQVGFSGHQE
eukprot:TRINITY_DN12569_c2_g1_i3.p1 TRINITY_DN12569_c2_g1~~TRINITY_DN12569_c2_g1_i3.p1  ORF type:complete len:483 (-),score=30.19 TRINITY_DN12569_c2_g1_i3:312-1760(-)